MEDMGFSAGKNQLDIGNVPLHSIATFGFWRVGHGPSPLNSGAKKTLQPATPAQQSMPLFRDGEEEALVACHFPGCQVDLQT